MSYFTYDRLSEFLSNVFSLLEHMICQLSTYHQCFVTISETDFSNLVFQLGLSYDSFPIQTTSTQKV
jgi:hypothetical protein